MFRLVVREESAVVRIACHGAKNHAQIAGAAWASRNQIQRSAKTDEQIVDLFGVAAKPVFLSWACMHICQTPLIIQTVLVLLVDSARCCANLPH